MPECNDSGQHHAITRLIKWTAGGGCTTQLLSVLAFYHPCAVTDALDIIANRQEDQQ